MLLPEEFKKLRSVDVTTVNPDELVDIREVQIDNNLDDVSKIMDYIEKIKNPYVFRYDDYVIKLEFDNESEITLQEVIEELVKKVAKGDGFIE